MPDRDGPAFVHPVRHATPHRFVPVLARMTAIDPGRKSDARQAGVSAWISKPVDPRSLVHAVERFCS